MHAIRPRNLPGPTRTLLQGWRIGTSVLAFRELRIIFLFILLLFVRILRPVRIILFRRHITFASQHRAQQLPEQLVGKVTIQTITQSMT